MARRKAMVTAGRTAAGDLPPPTTTPSPPSSRLSQSSTTSQSTTISSPLTSPIHWSRSAILARRRQMLQSRPTTALTTTILADAVAALSDPTIIAAATFASHPPLPPRITTAISPMATTVGPSTIPSHPTITLNVGLLRRLHELAQSRTLSIPPTHSTIVSTHRTLLPPQTPAPVTRDFVSSLGASTTFTPATTSATTSALTLERVQRLLAASEGGNQWSEPPPTHTSPLITPPIHTDPRVYLHRRGRPHHYHSHFSSCHHRVPTRH